MKDSPNGVTLKGVAATPGNGRPSAARALKPFEVAELVAIARGLPETWCVQILPPEGQLAIVPVAGRRSHHRCFSASRHWGAVIHENGIRPRA